MNRNQNKNKEMCLNQRQNQSDLIVLIDERTWHIRLVRFVFTHLELYVQGLFLQTQFGDSGLSLFLAL